MRQYPKIVKPFSLGSGLHPVPRSPRSCPVLTLAVDATNIRGKAALALQQGDLLVEGDGMAQISRGTNKNRFDGM